ncbi:MAG: sigma-70 family RNA polymerase sigma factor [Nitrospirae bacterium]|nr:sigma-70 family RNA polymerase sigma factor [Nitrospirota bacterium]
MLFIFAVNCCYLMVIAANATINSVKKTSRVHISLEDAAEENKAVIEILPDPQPSIIEQISESEQAELLKKLIEGLSSSDKLFLKYYFKDELQPEEIAEIMKNPAAETAGCVNYKNFQ